PFKLYRDIEPIPLAREWPASNGDVFTALSGTGGAPTEAPLSLRALAPLLYYSAGITRIRSVPGGNFYFRAAACTGALYEVELYVACGPLEGLDAGLYHFNPLDFALRKLRDGDWRGVL